jgi:putative PIG3 family NAD(P)H quinone oxidoreductase
MRAVVITQPGGPEVLEIRNVPDPTIGPDEVLVRVHAAGLNRADLLQRQGKYPAPPGVPADIPGLEFAGEIARVGERVSRWKPGQRGFGLLGGGGYAEFCVTHERALAEIPPNLNWIEAAAVPEAFITAHDALVTHAQLRSGDNVLIHAAASGVGLAAAQLAHAMGALPFGTSRTKDKMKRAMEFGYIGFAAPGESRDAIGTLAEQLSQLAAHTASGGFDVVIDLVGGPYVALDIDVAAPKGRIVLVGSVAGRKLELDQSKIMSKRLTIKGTVLRARPLEEKIAATQAFAREVVPLLKIHHSAGGVRPVIDSEFAFADVQHAHARLESNQTFGKVVLRLD